MSWIKVEYSTVSITSNSEAYPFRGPLRVINIWVNGQLLPRHDEPMTPGATECNPCRLFRRISGFKCL
jgi:hypothetical protein